MTTSKATRDKVIAAHILAHALSALLKETRDVPNLASWILATDALIDWYRLAEKDEK